MADENDFAPRMHPEDRKEIIAAMQLGRAEILVPDRPPAYATGRDAQIISEAMRIELDRWKIDVIRECKDTIREATATFLAGEEIERRINNKFKTVGLPVDDDNIEATGQAVRDVMRWRKRIDKVLGGIALAVVTAAIYGLARLAGINLPSPSAH